MDEDKMRQIVREIEQQLPSVEPKFPSDIHRQLAERFDEDNCSELQEGLRRLSDPVFMLDILSRNDWRIVPGVIQRPAEEVSEALRLYALPILQAEIDRKQCNGIPMS